MDSPVYTNARPRGMRHVPRDILQARQLLWDLVWKDIRVRYRYTALGFVWALLEPLALMLILTFVFSLVFRDRVDFDTAVSGPFAVFLLTGILFWQFTATSLSNATSALLDNRNLVKKVFFTREVIPLAALGYPLLNLAIGYLILLTLHLALGGTPGVGILLAPALFLIQFTLTAGLALLVSCGNVHYRDIGYIVGVALLFGFYATPILYPLDWVLASDLIPAWAQTLYLANPMAGLIAAYRTALFENTLPGVTLLAWPAVCAIATLLLGAHLFRRSAPTLSDHL